MSVVYGVITRAPESHWYYLNHPGGIMNTRAWPQNWLGGRLDMGMTVYNSAGTQVYNSAPATKVLTKNSASGTDGIINQSMPAGKYYIRVYNTGNGTDYPVYGSRGVYNLRYNL